MRRVAVVIPVITLVVLGIPAIARIGSAAQEATARADRPSLSGSWRLVVAEDQAPPFVALGTFGADGTVVVSPPPVVPASPNGPAVIVHTSAGHGAWQANGPDAAIFSFMLLAITEEGAPFGTRTVRSSVILSPDGQTFSGEYVGTVADPAGNTVATDAGTFEATRLLAEAPGAPPAGTPTT